MKLFHKKSHTNYNPTEKTPVIKCSICTGEQVAGFQDNATKAFEDIMLIQDASDLAHFREIPTTNNKSTGGIAEVPPYVCL